MADLSYKFTGVNTAQLANEVQLLRRSWKVRERIRAVALSIVCLIASASVASDSDALAQVQQPTVRARKAPSKIPSVKQIALTKAQIKGAIAASKEINRITDSAPEDIDRLSSGTTAQLDAVARKCGLSGYDEYKTILENVGLVFGGLDLVTRKYVGKETSIKAQIARVKADRKMSVDAKKETLQTLNDDLQLLLPPVENKGNIALVVKYFDELNATMPQGE